MMFLLARYDLIYILCNMYTYMVRNVFLHDMIIYVESNNITYIHIRYVTHIITQKKIVFMMLPLLTYIHIEHDHIM